MSGKSLLDFSPLTQPQKKHVARVYAALLVNVLMTGVGVYTQLYLVHLPSFLALLLSMSCVVGLSASSGPKVCLHFHEPPSMIDSALLINQSCTLSVGMMRPQSVSLFLPSFDAVNADVYGEPRRYVWSIWVVEWNADRGLSSVCAYVRGVPSRSNCVFRVYIHLCVLLPERTDGKAEV